MKTKKPQQTNETTTSNRQTLIHTLLYHLHRSHGWECVIFLFKAKNGNRPRVGEKMNTEKWEGVSVLVLKSRQRNQVNYRKNGREFKFSKTKKERGSEREKVRKERTYTFLSNVGKDKPTIPKMFPFDSVQPHPVRKFWDCHRKIAWPTV